MSVILDKMIGCFSDCQTIPGEQYDYYTWMPLHQEADEVIWSEEGSEYDDMEDNEEGRLGERKPPPVAEKSKLQKFFDEESNHGQTIPAERSAVVARKIGFAPSKGDERALRKKYGDNISAKQLEEWLTTVTHPEDSAAHLIKFFKQFDHTGTGYLTKAQIQNILTVHGGEESLTVEEFSNFIKRSNTTQDPIAYEELCINILKDN